MLLLHRRLLLIDLEVYVIDVINNGLKLFFLRLIGSIEGDWNSDSEERVLQAFLGGRPLRRVVL